MDQCFLLTVTLVSCGELNVGSDTQKFSFIPGDAVLSWGLFSTVNGDQSKREFFGCEISYTDPLLNLMDSYFVR